MSTNHFNASRTGLSRVGDTPILSDYPLGGMKP